MLKGLRSDMNEDKDYGGGVKRYYTSWGRDLEELECCAHMDATGMLARDESGRPEYYGLSISVYAALVDREKELLEDVIGEVGRGIMYQVDVLVFKDYGSLKRFVDGEVMIWRAGSELIIKELGEKKQLINN